MKRKVLVTFLTACVAIGMLSGCGNSGSSSKSSGAAGSSAAKEKTDVNEDGTVNNPESVKVDKNKLVFWSLFSGGDGEFMDKVIEDYNSGSPTKEVQSIMLVWDDYYTKLQTAVAAGKGPDIGVSHASKLPELVDQGVVEPIDGYLDDLGIDLSTMYSENSLKSVTFDGQIYAVPLDTHAEILYYNTDILSKAGVELNAEGKLDINSWEDFKSYVAEGIEDHQKFFQSGKAAFYFGGTWGTGALEKTENLKFAAQPWPQLFDNASCWADSHTLILPVNADRSEENSKAAVEFLVGASNKGGLTWAGSGQIPSANAVRESQEYKDMPYRSTYASALDTAVMPSKNPHFYAMKAGMIESLNTLWSGTADAATAIDSLTGELESNLE